MNYSFSEVGIKGIAFLVLPFFSYKLSTDEFGMYSLAGTLFSFLSILLILGVHAATTRYYHEKNIEDYKQFLISNLLIILILDLIVLCGAYFLAESICRWFNIERELFLYTMIAAVVNVPISIYLAHLRTIQKSQRHAIIYFVQNVVVIGLSVLFLFQLQQYQYLSKVYAQIITFCLLGGLCIVWILKDGKISIEISHIQYALAFGVPLLPHSLSRFILNLSDRLIINKIVGAAETGLYSYAYNIGMIVSIIVVAMNKAWVPAFYEAMRENDNEKINKVIPRCATIIYYLACMLILFTDYIGRLFAPQEYYSSLIIIPIIVVGYVLMFFYNVYINYSMYYKKSTIISTITMSVAAINIALNILLIPSYGYTMASVTTTISFFLMATSHYVYVKYIIKSELVLNIKKLIVSAEWVPITILGYYMLNFRIEQEWKQLIGKIIIALIITLIYLRRWKKINEK